MTEANSATFSQARLIIVGASLMLMIGIGIRQSFGLFLTPMTQDIGITASDYTLAFAVQNIAWGVSQALVGALADRFGLRIVMMLGTVIFGSGLTVMATAQGATALLVSGSLIGIALSCTTTSLTMSAVIRAVPESRRSRMLGLTSALGSIGMFSVPVITQGLLSVGTWRMGLWFFVFMVVVMVPAAFLAGGADRIPVQHAHSTSMRQVLGQAMRNRQFLVLSAAYFVCGLNLVFLTVHLPSYLALCGQDPMLGAAALAVIGGVSAAGSLVTGWLGDKYPRHILLGLLYILRSLMIAAYFMLPPTPASTLLFAAAMGLLWWPGLAPLIGGIVAQVFGIRYMATLLGISFVVHQAGSSLGAFGGGLIFDLFGSYDRAWQIGTIIGLAAGVVQIAFGGPPAKTDRAGIVSGGSIAPARLPA